MTHYANCFNCAVDKTTCRRRATIHDAIKGVGITSVKFTCDYRQPMFAAGQRVHFDWNIFDSEIGDSGETVTFAGTVLAEKGSRFVIQVDAGTDIDGNYPVDDTFTKNDVRIVKARPANMRASDEPSRIVCAVCYAVEGVAEDRCYSDDHLFHSPLNCAAGALIRARQVRQS